MGQSKGTRSSDLSIDIWHVVMLFVAQLPDGGRSLARARSVCKLFKEAADDKKVLRIVTLQTLDLLVKNQTSKLVASSSWESLKKAADKKRVLHSLKLWPPLEAHDNASEAKKDIDGPGQTVFDSGSNGISGSEDKSKAKNCLVTFGESSKKGNGYGEGPEGAQ